MSVADYTNDMNRNDYDIGASQDVQASIHAVAARLETALDQQDAQVKELMAQYQADGVSGQYQHLQDDWNKHGAQVREIIQAVKGSMGTNDEIAVNALAKGKAAVGG